MNITSLVRAINSTYNLVNPNLMMLEKEGIIKTSYLGRMRMISLNIDNKKTLILMKALHILNSCVGEDESDVQRIV